MESTRQRASVYKISRWRRASSDDPWSFGGALPDTYGLSVDAENERWRLIDALSDEEFDLITYHVFRPL
jgi:hypothetical protein